MGGRGERGTDEGQPGRQSPGPDEGEQPERQSPRDDVMVKSFSTPQWPLGGFPGGSSSVKDTSRAPHFLTPAHAMNSPSKPAICCATYCEPTSDRAAKATC